MACITDLVRPPPCPFIMLGDDDDDHLCRRQDGPAPARDHLPLGHAGLDGGGRLQAPGTPLTPSPLPLPAWVDGCWLEVAWEMQSALGLGFGFQVGGFGFGGGVVGVWVLRMEGCRGVEGLEPKRSLAQRVQRGVCRWCAAGGVPMVCSGGCADGLRRSRHHRHAAAALSCDAPSHALLCGECW